MAEKLVYLNDHTGENGTLKEGDDLKKSVKETLAKYLSKITKEENVYPISPGVDNMNLEPGGIPLALDLGPNGAEKVFSPQSAKDKGSADLTFYSNPEMDPKLQNKNVETLSNLLKKGQVAGAPSTAKSGHDFLPSIKQTSDVMTSGLFTDPDPSSENPIVKRTSAVLTKNRFSPGAPYSALAAPLGIISTIQSEFGVYNPNARTVSADNFAEVGKSMMLRATGEFIARGEGAHPDDGDVAAATLIPGEAQLAVTKIDFIDVDAKEIFREIFGEEFGARLQSDFQTDTSGDSYGSLNNPNEIFDSLAPLGMIALSTALVLAVQIAIKAIMAVVGVITGGKTSGASQTTKDQFGRPLMGQYQKFAFEGSEGFPGSLFLSPALLGLRATDNDFAKCVNEGMNVFFGADDGGGIVDSLVSEFKRILEAPGYMAIFIRGITRSANTIAMSVKNIAGGSNPMDTANGIIAMIDTIRSSKVVSALNMFAQIGDRSKNLKKAGFDTSKLAPGQRYSVVDEIPVAVFAPDGSIIDNPLSHHMKSRRGGQYPLTLAWRNSATPSLYALPENVLKADLLLKDGLSSVALMGRTSSTVKVLKHPENRIKKEVVDGIENLLDAEYVPFYFHDLRTNEIISFHAFLEDVSDSYTANYDSSDVYGRIDPVMIYKNTNRQITLSFAVASTSERDFDEMWLKINKLVTMVYPQFSKGTEVIAGQTKFVQPFSQYISASPLIRLRLGDLFRTNYSKFALARLFGLGSDSFSSDGSKNLADNLETMINNVKAIESLLALGLFAKGDQLRLRANVSPGAIDAKQGYPTADSAKPPSLGGAIGGAVTDAIGIGGDDDDKDAPLLLAYPAIVKIESVEDNGKFAISLVNTGISSKIYLVSLSDLYAEPEDISKIVKKLAGLENGQLPANNFFDKLNNPIVRSFESTGGKGLAGFITSLSFSEWNTTTWDTERYGSRAPKYMKVNINFAPIHDIAPGIDSDGFNRAPIYNIGEIVNGFGKDGTDTTQIGKSAMKYFQEKMNEATNTKKK